MSIITYINPCLPAGAYLVRQAVTLEIQQPWDGFSANTGVLYVGGRYLISRPKLNKIPKKKKLLETRLSLVSSNFFR